MAIYKISLKLELNPGPDKMYTVTSPDVPGLVTEGSTLEEIWRNVQDAINSMVEVFQREGWELPPALQPEKAIPIEEINTLPVAA